jgi:DNA-binding response OmpR family regulator
VKAKILFVEDDDAIRETTRVALEDEDYVVSEATTGEEALRSFERGTVDCVLLDLMLPDRTGFDICRELRQRSSVPIIMVTARSDTFDVVAGLEAGPTTTSPSPSSRRSWPPVSGRCFAGPGWSRRLRPSTTAPTSS